MENNQQAISSDLIRGHIDTIILHSLLSGDKYAQQISESVEEKSENKYSINRATLYSSLKRLENLKFVDSYWFDVADGRRKFFKITEKGKKEVDKNLSSWAFSRQIIDKLMDTHSKDEIDKNKPAAFFVAEQKEQTEASPAPKIIPYKTNESLVNSVNNTVYFSDKTNNYDAVSRSENTSSVGLDSEKSSLNVDKTDEKEINFRNILNGLIRNSEQNPSSDGEDFKQEIDKIDDDECEKPKFNETITISDYGAQRFGNNGKIDYGDLISDAAKDGYKLKISSKDSAKPFGNLYYNKLKFYSSLSFLVLISIEIIIFSLTAYKNNFKFIFAFLPFLCVLSLSVVFGLIYLRYPLKTSSKKYNGDKILTASIIAFNLLLLTFALNFLFGTDFENKLNIISYVIVPIVSICDLIIYFIIEFLFSKFSIFHVKRV